MKLNWNNGVVQQWITSALDTINLISVLTDKTKSLSVFNNLKLPLFKSIIGII